MKTHQPTLKDARAALAASGFARFAAAYGPALLCGHVQEESRGWTFRTVSTGLALPIAGATHGCVLLDSMLVFPLRKASKQVFGRDTVLVGRATTNDVVLAHPTVSKLHARMSCRAGAQWFLQDAGSCNNTWLNNAVILDTEPHPVRHEDLLRLGNVELRFLEAQELGVLLQHQGLP